MTESAEVAARVADLRQQIAYHNERYHTLDSPEIADAEYDMLVRELLRLEEEHPELASTESPTSQVGGAPLSATFAGDPSAGQTWLAYCGAAGSAVNRHRRPRLSVGCDCG